MRDMMDGENLVGGEEDQVGGAVLIRIHVPDLNIHKCLQFYRQDLVWDVKQQCLASLPKELKESFNYGLFAPPCNGKAGKFLDEERPLTDYPFSGPVGYLELRYKRRLYKGLSVDEKQLKSLHTKSNLKRFVDYVSSGHCEKVIKMCAKGLDPNFHCPDSGETPLSMAAVMKKPSKLLIALVNGGALLDYRTRDGATAMHRAVEAKSLEAVKTLLDLGGSPNYKDAKGLTPLYLSVAANADPALCEALLHDHAFLGAQDLQGWNETHQACRNGLIHHLEHLLYYGADMNAKNASGNTPLHVCAVNNQESCVRLLLFRGADKEALNFANQTPYQVAVIAGNMELAEIIQNHRPQDVVTFRDVPKYNPKRRPVKSRALCDPRLNCSMTCLSGRVSRGPPSPCPSNRSLPPFSSASSSMSTHSGSYSESSYSGGSSHFGSEDNCGSAITDKSLDHSDITSDSSGVGTCNSGGSGSSYDATPTDPALILPGMMVVCVENYAAQSPRHLKLTEGDIIEVTASTDTGLLEGSLKGQIGLFPLSCVQEIRMKSYESRNHLLPPSRGQGKRDTATTSKQCAKSPRIKKMYYTFEHHWGEPHTVILHRGQKGFGFILRGAKSDSPLMELQASDRFPALQYLDDVDVNGVADRAGLRKGDFVLAINSVDVTLCSHEAVVDLIRKSGELVSLTVLGLSLPSNIEQESSKPGSPASLTCDQSSDGTPKAQYHFATLPRKFSAGSNGAIGVPSPPRRDPTTSLSVGRARAKSMVAALADLGITNNIGQDGVGVKSNSVDSITGKPPLPPSSIQNGGLQLKTASIRARPTSSRITATEIQEIFTEKAMNGDLNGTCSPADSAYKIYASVSEMKRSKSGLKGKELVTLHKDFHSTPDLKEFVKQVNNGSAKITPGIPPEIKSLSQESLNKLKANPRHSWACISSTTQAFRNYESSWKSIEKIPAFDEKKDLQPPVPPPEPAGGDGDGGVESDGGSESSSSESSGEETPTAAVVKSQVLTESEYRTSKPLRPIQSKTLPRRASTGCTAIGPAEQQTIINLVPPGQVIKVDVSKSKEYASLDIASTMLSRRDSCSSSVMSSFKPTDSAKLYASPDDLKSIGYRETGEGNNAGTTGTLKKTRSHSVPRGNEESVGGAKGRDYARPDLTAGKGQELTNGLPRKTDEVIRGAKTDDQQTNLEKDDGPFDPQKSLQEAKDRLKPVLKGNLINNANNQSATKIRIEVKQSPRLARKSEKTVTFQAEAPPTNSPVSQAATGQMSHSLSVDEFQKVKSSLKSSKSFPNDLGLEDGDGNSSSGVSSDGGAETTTTTTTTQAQSQSTFTNNYVTCLPVNPDSDSSEDSSDKTWILKEENGGMMDDSSRNSQFGAPLQKQLNELKALSASSQDGHGHFGNTQPVMGNSAAQTQSAIFLTNRAAQDSSSAHSNYGTLGRVPNTRPQSGGNLTKNAVSLVKLPPPMELESESEEKSPRDTPTPKPAQLSSNPMYHTLQPQRSRPMLGDNSQMQNTAVRQLQYQGQVQGPTRQAEKSIEESLQLIRMHVAALKQEFPSASPSPIDFGGAKSQTPILAPPPEFSDARDTHESCTRFNQGLLNMAGSGNDPQQPFNRHSPLYRSISHTHSSSSSNYSGYPTMTRQQYQLQQQQSIQMQQQQHQQYQQLAQHGQNHVLGQQGHALAQPHPLTQQQLQQLTPQQQYQLAQQRQAAAAAVAGQPGQQQHQMSQQQVMSSSMPAYHTLGRTPSYSTGAAQTMLNKSGHGHYQTLTSVKQQQQGQQHPQQMQQHPQQLQQHPQQLQQHPQQLQQHSQQMQPPGQPSSLQNLPGQSGSSLFQQQHHPKCYYYQQTPSSTGGNGKYIPEKLHPVNRYTPDICENGPRIVGTIPKKPPGADHYEVPHAHQLLLAQQQQQQGQQGVRVRREFRNKTLPEWSVGDACDWLDSLFMPEYKVIFQQKTIDGKKLIRMDNSTLLELGVKKLGHRMNIEKSLKRYMPQPKT